MNDTACRDAARAAAQGNSQTQATSLAQAILVSHKQVNSYLGSPVLQTPIIYQDYNGSPPDTQTSPYIQLTTRTQVTLPIRFFSFLSQMFTSDQNLTFTATYMFPIVRVK